jgi:hypothetical protein
VIPQEYAFTYVHAVLYARAHVKCVGGDDEESSLLVEIHLAVIRVVVVVVGVAGVVLSVEMAS